jgi:hypothetical protein
LGLPLPQRLLERFEESGDLSCGHEDASADGRLGVEAGEEIEPEFARPVGDHHAIGIGPAQDTVGDLEVVVDFLRGGATGSRGWRDGARLTWP